jgi:hypothetical protein
MTAPSTNSHDAFISWAHQTIRLCVAVYNLDNNRAAPNSAEALALTHDLWDRAVAESGKNAKPGHVDLMFARIVLDWCATFRAK